jgi:segregation and condensation protein B
MDQRKLKNIVEAALLAAGRPMSVEQIQALFSDIERPERTEIKAAIEVLEADYAERAIRIIEVASGWRIQVREEMAGWVSRLWQDRPARYSRALLETLALIAYRQPITRGEIEDIRGVSVSSNIMRTLMERGWVRIVGHRDVPGRPGMYATTREFLDYFGLKKLEDLPPLAEIRDLDSISVELDLGLMELPPVSLPEEAGEHEETTDTDDAPQDIVRA